MLKSELGKLEFLSDGAFGTVYKTEYKLGYSSTNLVYKGYKAALSGLDHASFGESAEKAVRFRDDLTVADRAELDSYFVWPREVVTGDTTGDICGFLMPAIPSDFCWPNGRPAGMPRTLDWFTTTESVWRANHVDMSDVTLVDRLFFVTQLVYAVAWLHRRGWVFGDLSFRKAVFALYPLRLMLLGCDTAASLADRKRGPQPHTPNWVPPECQGSDPLEQDALTDVYKLGLAIVRCLKPSPGATTTRDVGRLTSILDADGIQLLTRALSADRGTRPTAKDLYAYLRSVTTALTVPPVIVAAQLLTPWVMRGSYGRIVWQIQGAEEIRVLLGETSRVQVQAVTPADHPDGCVFPVTQSGQVTVLASNRYGNAQGAMGDVALFEVPTNSWAQATFKPGTPAGHAFISYVRENTGQVDQLQRALRAAGITVWRDTEDLWPGQDWRREIRRAISQNALVFIACFSEASLARPTSYQNEELTLAIDQLQLRPQGELWLIPVRLDECEVPDLDIGAGRTLRWIQSADLFGERSDKDTARLIAIVHRILGRGAAGGGG